MNVQERFDQTVNLLKSFINEFPEITPVIDNYYHTEVQFGFFRNPGPPKEALLNTYEIRADIEEKRKDNPHVTGYEKLLPRFRATQLEFINVSSFTTETETLLVFSDFGLTDLVGILISKSNLGEYRSQEEPIFVNGVLVE